MSAELLKPCPFEEGNEQYMRRIDEMNFEVRCKTKCDGCLGRTPEISRTQVAAARQWNERVDMALAVIARRKTDGEGGGK